VPYCSRIGSLKVRFMSIGIAIGIAILLNQEYRYRYRRYFYAEISLSVSAILFFGGQTLPETTSGCLSLGLSKISYGTLEVNDERTRDKSGTQHKKTGQVGVPSDIVIFPGQTLENRDCPGKTGTDGHLNKAPS
jgi:hypothetical protein